MTPRDLALRAAVNLCAFAACVLALIAISLRALLVELADEVAASRNEHRTNNRNRLRGNMPLPQNIKLTDIVSQHRAVNARLAAVVGVNTSQARGELSDARQLAAELAMPRRML